VTAALVKVEDGGAVRTLTLHSPHNRNALSIRLLDELADALAATATDTSVRALVLTGDGPVFCSGADLSEGPARGPSRMPEILTALTQSRVPVIARVNGHARAGGIGLIAAADMAVAPEAATFAFSEVKVGVAPALIMVPALRVATRRFLSHLMLTGQTFSAAQAADAGLLTAAVATEEALEAWVDDALGAIALTAPGAVAATKQLLATLPELDWSEALERAAERSAELFGGPEAAEGMAAFLAKRAPAWQRVAPS
jgi:methylglutaconyl-CoA hydratase